MSVTKGQGGLRKKEKRKRKRKKDQGREGLWREILSDERDGVAAYRLGLGYLFRV